MVDARFSADLTSRLRAQKNSAKAADIVRPKK